MREAHNFKVMSLKRQVSEGTIEPRALLPRFTQVAESCDLLGLKAKARRWRRIRQKVEFGLSVAHHDPASYRALRTLVQKLVGCKEGLNTRDSRALVKELGYYKRLDAPGGQRSAGGATWGQGRPSSGFGSYGGRGERYGRASFSTPAKGGGGAASGPTKRRCYQCGQPGHIRSECNARPQQIPRGDGMRRQAAPTPAAR